MSAYVVGREHIIYLVEAGLVLPNWGRRHSHITWIWNIDGEYEDIKRGELYPADYEAAQRVGQMLWDENLASVRYRYPDSPDKLPGPIDCDYQYPETTPPFMHIDPIQVLSSCDCYGYQSCEHDGWATSEAKAFIGALQQRAWMALPGYEDAKWGAPEPYGKQRRRALHIADA